MVWAATTTLARIAGNAIEIADHLWTAKLVVLASLGLFPSSPFATGHPV
jgi:hypothetical protein